MLNRFNLTRPKYDVELTAASGGGFSPGVGLIMADPAYPTRAPVRAFEAPVDLMVDAAPEPLNEIEIRNSAITFRSASSAHEEAQMLARYFRLGFPFAGFAAAYSEGQRVFTTSRTTYALVQQNGQSLQLPENAIGWGGEDVVAESLETDGERLRQFVYTYGSHYISSVLLGYRVAIRAQVRTTDSSAFESMKASFDAAINLWSAGGGVSSTHLDQLKKHSVEVTAEIVAGSIAPAGAYVLTGLESVAEFLVKLRTGEVVITAAPTRAVAFSYWATLSPDAFPKCRAVLAESEPVAPLALHGVPRGTVIAWSPPPENIVPSQDPGGEPAILPPEGWALCDGNGTPDLRARFVRGTHDLREVGIVAGEDSHTHEYRMFGATMDNDQAASAYDVGYVRASAFLHGGQNGEYRNHAHRLKLEPGSSLPPCVSLVYIIRR